MNWGIGHAARMIPIIDELNKFDTEVVIVANGDAFHLLSGKYPSLKIKELPGLNVSYSDKRISFWSHLIKQLPSFMSGVHKEHKKWIKLVDDIVPDGIISDNRFSVWHSTLPTVIITHQVNIQIPLFSRVVKLVNNYYLKKFDEYWIPDYMGKYAGKLSIPNEGKEIGILSRFEKVKEAEKEYDFLGVVSGPEPQRSIFFDLLLSQAIKLNLKAVILMGKPGRLVSYSKGNCKVFSHLNDAKFAEVVARSKGVIARSGYSTLMDVSFLGVKASFVPTPGQTEQEYLAAYHESKGHYFYMKQEEFDLELCIQKFDEYSGIQDEKTSLLKDQLKCFLDSID